MRRSTPHFPSSRLLLLGLVVLGASPARGVELTTGGYAFSDELGGFRLVGAGGTGTLRDPVILEEHLTDIAPVTLTVRRSRPDLSLSAGGLLTLTIEIVVTNCSGRVWAGFEIELQEKLKRPSVYADGLSFNQFGAEPPDVASDAFADNNRLFEPYDRIRFEAGHVDPDAAARFRMTITDPTPTATFYVVQDPKILSASLTPQIMRAAAEPGCSDH